MTSSDTNTSLDNLIIEGIRERKGRGITILDLSQIDGAAANEFIICEGASSMQVAAIADSVREYLLEHSGKKPYNYDGYKNSEWIVIDYGDTLVHVFHKHIRDHYNLEELWSDARVTRIPDLD